MNLDFTKDVLLQLPWKEENAQNQPKQKVQIFLIALTTCAYCKRGMAMVKEKNAAYRWFYLDELSIDERQPIKDWLKQKYNASIGFPFVVFRMPDKDYVSSGFDPDYWSAKIK